jgi:chromosome segregation ATPase
MSDRQDSDAITDMQEEIAALRAERDEALRNGRKTSEQADTVARELIAAEARAERAERAVLDEDRARRDAQAECSRLWEALDRLQRNFDAEVALVVRLREALRRVDAAFSGADTLEPQNRMLAQFEALGAARAALSEAKP